LTRINAGLVQPAQPGNSASEQFMARASIAEGKVFGLIPLSRFYRDPKATRLGKVFSRFWAAWSALGLPSVRMVELELTGGKTGRPVRLAVVVTNWDHDAYLVSMLGECAWVRNARADPHA
jgi:hypothetical protein